MSQFSKGDQVQVKSGGPIMTIQQLGDLAIDDGISDGDKCIWFYGKTPIEKVFNIATLEIFYNFKRRHFY